MHGYYKVGTSQSCKAQIELVRFSHALPTRYKAWPALCTGKTLRNRICFKKKVSHKNKIILSPRHQKQKGKSLKSKYINGLLGGLNMSPS